MLQIEFNVERLNKQGQWEFVAPPDKKRWYCGTPNKCLASVLGLHPEPWAQPPVRLQNPTVNVGLPPDASAALQARAAAVRRAKTRYLKASWLSGYSWEKIRRNVVGNPELTAHWMQFRREFLGSTWGTIRALQKPDLVRLTVWENAPAEK